MTVAFGRLRPGAPSWREGLAGLQWLAIIVPPSLGMWVFGAALIGIPLSSLGTALAGALFATGVATLLQLALGWRVSVFEGPASIHLATLVIVAGGQGGTASAGEIMGGLLVAGAVVLLLRLTRADRFLDRIFTPGRDRRFRAGSRYRAVAGGRFPSLRCLSRRSGGDGGGLVDPLGHVGRGRRRVPTPGLAAFRLACHFGGGRWNASRAGLARVSRSRRRMGGAYAICLGYAALLLAGSLPFALASVAAALNIVGSVSAVLDPKAGRSRYGQGLVVNGLAQGLHTAFVGFIGTVGHVESASIVRMLGTSRRRSLAIATAGLVTLSFVDPAVRVMAAIPPHISGVLLLVLLLVLGVVGIEMVRSFAVPVRWMVIAPALVPPLWWTVSTPSGRGITAFLNPLVLAIVIAVVTEHLLRRFVQGRVESPAGSERSPRSAGLQREGPNARRDERLWR